MSPSVTHTATDVLPCPGCGSSKTFHYPASRKTGRSVLGCRACGLKSWAERAEFITPDFTETSDRDLSTEYDGYASGKRLDMVDAAWVKTIERLQALSSSTPSPKLFDVGAGDGKFLKLAQSYGFEVAGNEVHAGAAQLASERNGFQLQVGDLSELDLEPIHDALTMWCVMVHTEDVDRTLENCNALLKPGGTMFLQTPHWTTVDAMALSALRVSGGRVNRIVDRRVAWHHWQLHTKRSIQILLDRHGFDTFDVKPMPRYSLNSVLYMRSLGVPDNVAQRTSKAVDLAIKYGPMPRIVLDVYARKR